MKYQSKMDSIKDVNTNPNNKGSYGDFLYGFGLYQFCDWEYWQLKGLRSLSLKLSFYSRAEPREKSLHPSSFTVELLQGN